jgi:hypothetical protein
LKSRILRIKINLIDRIKRIFSKILWAESSYLLESAI